MGSVTDEAGAGLWGACGLVVGGFVRHVGGNVSPDKYYPIATTTDHPLVCRSGAHSCGDAHHNCTFVRFCARAREDVQGMGVHILRGRTSYLATLSRFDDLVPLSFTEAPLACHHEGCPLMLLPIHLEFAWVLYLAICACPQQKTCGHGDH